METKVHVTPNEKGELIILQGNAIPHYDPVKLDLSGILNTITEFITIRVGEIDWLKCNMCVDRSGKIITLTINESDHFFGTVKGVLEMHPDYLKFDINRGKWWPQRDFGEFVKMNRALFADRQAAMSLVNELMNLDLKTEKELKKSDNNRGDFERVIKQKVIKSNIPEQLTLNVPLFKGSPRQSIIVEIYVNPDNFSVQLVSPEAAEKVQEVRDKVFDEVIGKVREMVPTLLIYEK